MAAGQIKITPETMRQRATQYRKEANEVHASYSNMDALLRTLHTEWEGRAADSYDARYQSLRPNFLKAEDLINRPIRTSRTPTRPRQPSLFALRRRDLPWLRLGSLRRPCAVAPRSTATSAIA